MTQIVPILEDDGPQGSGAYRQILADIRAGVLLPGARLRETELAERLGISRTPVREAMRQLEADGLVAHVPRQGATIRVLDYAEVMELYEMRAVLESTAARLAARAASDMELDALTALNAEMASAKGAATVYELNRQFHMTMLDAAKNRYLVKSVNALQKTLLILGPTTLVEPVRATEAVGEHEIILAALRDRDGLRAETAMRAHIEAAHRVRLRALLGRDRPIEGI
ncbi:GntR family transcriptional regulator [Pseudorhodobacter sp.]|uniref:GntR family transcriptional regulator n=1 Tax=Pseudorhodobacter sp. TaxID=1934400 RepID=UPI002647CCB1|nr:GntR family transcriptional regulator [Pseudorhodobacter sp.]MDN5788836.1 GntR family transcriptional regulator [Pseudorhodobacter sp.]